MGIIKFSKQEIIHTEYLHDALSGEHWHVITFKIPFIGVWDSDKVKVRCDAKAKVTWADDVRHVTVHDVHSPITFDGNDSRQRDGHFFNDRCATGRRTRYESTIRKWESTMAFKPVFKPKLKDSYYIFNTNTGLYSRGGMYVKWGRSPKTWTKGGVKLHLVQHRDFYVGHRLLKYGAEHEQSTAHAKLNGTYNFDTDFIYDMDTNELATDVTLAGFLIKSSYDDQMKGLDYKNKVLRGYIAEHMMYEEALKKGRTVELHDKMGRCESLIKSYQGYVEKIELDLSIIKEFATKHGVVL